MTFSILVLALGKTTTWSIYVFYFPSSSSFLNIQLKHKCIFTSKKFFFPDLLFLYFSVFVIQVLQHSFSILNHWRLALLVKVKRT